MSNADGKWLRIKPRDLAHITHKCVSRGRTTYYTQCVKCLRPVVFNGMMRAGGARRCRLCVMAVGWWKKTPIISKRVWALRRRIRKITYSANGWKPHYWIKCRRRGCQNLVNATTMSKAGWVDQCKDCKYLSHRKPAYVTFYNDFVSRIKKRDLLNTLTFKQFVKLFAAKKCHYCKASVVKPTHRWTDGLKTKNISFDIDRIDPTKGYTVENCVPCCTMCNYSKSVLINYAEMKVLGYLRNGDKKTATRFIQKRSVAAWKVVRLIGYNLDMTRENTGQVIVKRRGLRVRGGKDLALP